MTKLTFTPHWKYLPAAIATVVIVFNGSVCAFLEPRGGEGTRPTPSRPPNPYFWIRPCVMCVDHSRVFWQVFVYLSVPLSWQNLVSTTALWSLEQGKNWRGGGGGGLGGLDPQWKTDNPHCKRQGKKLGGRVSTPLGTWFLRMHSLWYR